VKSPRGQDGPKEGPFRAAPTHSEAGRTVWALAQQQKGEEYLFTSGLMLEIRTQRYILRGGTLWSLDAPRGKDFGNRRRYLWGSRSLCIYALGVRTNDLGTKDFGNLPTNRTTIKETHKRRSSAEMLVGQRDSSNFAIGATATRITASGRACDNYPDAEESSSGCQTVLYLSY
jgi:hypothetical protein